MVRHETHPTPEAQGGPGAAAAVTGRRVVAGAPLAAGAAEPGALGAGVPEPIGAYLARQRVLRGISLDELEQFTRIPRRSLERLESGQFDAQPDGFVRGFVRTVALALGLDPQETVTRMLVEPAPTRVRHAGGPGRWVVAAAVLALLAGSLGAALVWWMVAGARPSVALERPADDGVLRRWDPVRALAEAQGTVRVVAEAPPSETPAAPAVGPTPAVAAPTPAPTPTPPAPVTAHAAPASADPPR